MSGNAARVLCLSLVITVVACAAPPQGDDRTGGTSQPERSASPKRIVAAMRAAPASLSQTRTNRSVGSVPGLDAVEELVHAGLAHTNEQGVLMPQLAEAVPTLENGLWQVLPDGRMVTTWKLKPGVHWHDGAPLTSADLLFTAMVEQDKELGIPLYPAYESIDAITAPDPATVTVTWKQPYIEADALFTYRVGLPMPKHLLEGTYTQDKAAFVSVPYWSQEFVGAGPFKMREWVPDSHLVLRRFDDYVLGRPLLDEIEVKFIPDPVTLLANVLAGVEMTLGRTVSLEQALEVRDQWREGSILLRGQSWTPINAQFVNTSPPIITDVRFRRAMLHAIDRQQLVETIMAGQSSVAHSFVNPDTPLYDRIEGSIVRYPYDQRRAMQMIEQLGYARGPDGFFVDASGQKLTVPISTTVQNAMQPKATAAVADFWQAAGVMVEQIMIPIQRGQDREYRAQYPGFELIETGNTIGPNDVRRYHSTSAALPENRFTANGNNPRYMNPEFDALIERYVTTIPMPERMQVLGGIVQHISENLTHMGLFYGVSATLANKRLKNATARGPSFTQAWNAHEWDV
jgi:peptide/nickel transport system substrate-binding protein